MSNTRKYRLLSGSHTRWEGDKKSGTRVVYNRDDTMSDLSEEEIASFGERIKEVAAAGAETPAGAVSSAPAAVAPASTPNGNGGSTPYPLSGSAQDVKIYLLSVSSVSDLESLKEQERRPAILKLIQARIDKLSKPK